MKLTCAVFLTLLVVVFLATSCIKQPQTFGMITESKALELAQNEFIATGRKADDYRATIETDSNGQNWIVWFDTKGPYATPGGKHAVKVEKTTGITTFLPGE